MRLSIAEQVRIASGARRAPGDRETPELASWQVAQICARVKWGRFEARQRTKVYSQTQFKRGEIVSFPTGNLPNVFSVITASCCTPVVSGVAEKSSREGFAQLSRN